MTTTIIITRMTMTAILLYHQYVVWYTTAKKKWSFKPNWEEEKGRNDVIIVVVIAWCQHC